MTDESNTLAITLLRATGWISASHTGIQAVEEGWLAPANQMLRELKPDYCIAIHHDSNASSKLNGMGAYYYYPFSKAAAKYVLDNCFDTGIYKDKTFKWHYYYMSRVSVCPVVLTENGYYSNKYDYNNIIDDKVNTTKAEALTKGIVEYFTSIQ